MTVTAASSDLTLYVESKFVSPYVFACFVTLTEKGLPFSMQPLDTASGDTKRDEYLARTITGRVPSLAHGAFAVAESSAIIEYLDERYPAPPLLPREPMARAQVRAMALTVACDIHPLGNLRVLNYLRGEFRQPEEAVNAWARHWIETGFVALEAAVRRHSGDGRHSYGSAVSLADVYLVPQMYNARRYGCDLSASPTLVAIDAALRERTDFAAAAPERQPDAGA